MKSLVLKNVDMELLREQKAALVKVRAECRNMIDNMEYRAPEDEEMLALDGIIHLLDSITDANEDNHTLEDQEVDSIVVDLKVLLAICARNDMSSRAHDLALKRAVNFLECKPFPVGGK